MSSEAQRHRQADLSSTFLDPPKCIQIHGRVRQSPIFSKSLVNESKQHSCLNSAPSASPTSCLLSMCCLGRVWERKKNTCNTKPWQLKVERALWFCSPLLNSPGITAQLFGIATALIQLPKKLKLMQNTRTSGQREGGRERNFMLREMKSNRMENKVSPDLKGIQ